MNSNGQSRQFQVAEMSLDRGVVLVIEEDQNRRAAYAAILKRNGFAVITAGRLNERLRDRLNASRPSLTVVHCDELARSCRRDPALSPGAILTLGSWKLGTTKPSRLVRRHCTPEQLLAFVIAATQNLQAATRLEVG